MPAPLRVYFLYEFSLETVRMPNLDAAIQVVGLRPYLISRVARFAPIKTNGALQQCAIALVP